MIRKAFIMFPAMLAASASLAWVWTSSGGASISVLSYGAYDWRLDISVDNLHRSLRIVYPRSTGRRDAGPITSRPDTGSANVRESVVGPWLGLSCKHSVMVFPGETVRVTGVDLPLWMLVVVCGSCPAVALIRGPWRRYRRRKRGLCPHCGYNLSGNVTGACPECGADLASSVERA